MKNWYVNSTSTYSVVVIVVRHDGRIVWLLGLGRIEVLDGKVR